ILLVFQQSFCIKSLDHVCNASLRDLQTLSDVGHSGISLRIDQVEDLFQVILDRRRTGHRLIGHKIHLSSIPPRVSSKRAFRARSAFALRARCRAMAEAERAGRATCGYQSAVATEQCVYLLVKADHRSYCPVLFHRTTCSAEAGKPVSTVPRSRNGLMAKSQSGKDCLKQGAS